MLSLKHDTGIDNFIVTLHVWYGQRLSLHQIVAGNVTHAGNYYMLGTTTISSMPFQVLGLWSHLKEIFFLSLDLTVTNVNTKKCRNKKIEVEVNIQPNLSLHLFVILLLLNIMRGNRY